MRILVDNCLSWRLARALAEDGHDVEFVGDWASDPGDEFILEYANGQRRVVITLDSDYTTLAMFHHAAHAGIIRLNRVRPVDYVSETRRAISLHGADLEAAAVVIIDRGEMRIRRTD